MTGTHARTLGLGVAVLALAALTLLAGGERLAPVEVARSLAGSSRDPFVDFLVLDLRMPVVLTAIGVGLATGAAGTIFQRVLGNPLASPDLVGISSGASFFAIAALTFASLSAIPVSAAALTGALIAVAAIWLLAWRDGLSGYRFVLIGLAVSQLFLSLVGWVIARAQLSDAQEALTWLVGSVGRAGDRELVVLWCALAIGLPLARLMERRLALLELGDDTARALGLRVERDRAALLALAVALVALAVAAAGPLAFVALMAGPIASRLVGSVSRTVIPAALAGAALVLAADFIGQHLLPTALPTGVVTGAVGAPYLIWLLTTTHRQGRGE